MTVESFFDRSIDFNNDSVKMECFDFFDKEQKHFLNEEDFLQLIASLLHKETSVLNSTSDLFMKFDRDKDRKISVTEFTNVWSHWIRTLSLPVTALLIVDVQNDFIDGSLAMKNCPARQNGSEVVPIINELVQKVNFDVVVYSIDYHPENHISFFENVNKNELSNESKKKDLKLFDTVIFKGPPQVKQKLWPKHCVQGTWGAQLHENLKFPESALYMYKGTNPNIDSYSAFWDNNKVEQTKLQDELKQRGVTHVFVCGLAYDYCVSFTALDALDLGYATVMIEDASRGTDTYNMEVMRTKLKENYCVMANSSELQNLVKGRDIRQEFAYVLGNAIEHF